MGFLTIKIDRKYYRALKPNEQKKIYEKTYKVKIVQSGTEQIKENSGSVNLPKNQ